MNPSVDGSELIEEGECLDPECEWYQIEQPGDTCCECGGDLTR